MWQCYQIEADWAPSTLSHATCLRFILIAFLSLPLSSTFELAVTFLDSHSPLLNWTSDSQLASFDSTSSLDVEPRPHSGGAKRVDSKADGPVFHPGRGAYTNPLSTDKTGSQEASTDERKGKPKTVCSPLAECRRGSPTSHFKVWSHSEGKWPHGYECIPWKQNKSGFEPEPCCVYLMLLWANYSLVFSSVIGVSSILTEQLGELKNTICIQYFMWVNVFVSCYDGLSPILRGDFFTVVIANALWYLDPSNQLLPHYILRRHTS